MYKYIAGAVIFICVAYIGWQIKQIYHRKYKFYCDLSMFCDKLCDEITVYKTSLTKVIDSFVSGKDGALVKLLTLYKQNLENNIIYCDNSQELIPKTLFLTKDESQEIVNFLNNIGKTDYDSQIAFIKRSTTDFNFRKDKAKEDTLKKGDLYFKLSIMLGFAIILLII